MFVLVVYCFFFKQKTAYEMRISDWSSDVCSSDLFRTPTLNNDQDAPVMMLQQQAEEIGRAMKLAPDSVGISSQLPAPIALQLLGWNAAGNGVANFRSDERRVGKECVSQCRSRWSPYHYKKKNSRENKGINR